MPNPVRIRYIFAEKIIKATVFSLISLPKNLQILQHPDYLRLNFTHQLKTLSGIIHSLTTKVPVRSPRQMGVGVGDHKSACAFTAPGGQGRCG